MMDEGNNRVWMFPVICANQGWMIEFILDQDIQPCWQTKGEGCLLT